MSLFSFSFFYIQVFLRPYEETFFVSGLSGGRHTTTAAKRQDMFSYVQYVHLYEKKMIFQNSFLSFYNKKPPIKDTSVH